MCGRKLDFSICPICGKERESVRMNKQEIEKAHTCETCKYNYPNHDITMKEECGGCCSWNDKWEPKEVKDE
jgi:hypothetical protein